MELATLFSVAYHYEIPTGSIMLVSDMPLNKRGVKDKKRHEEIYANHMEPHLELGMDAVLNLQRSWGDVEKRLRSEW
jgi:AMP nucleosidase